MGVALRRHTVPTQSGRVPFCSVEPRRHEDYVGLEVKGQWEHNRPTADINKGVEGRFKPHPETE